MSFLTKRSLTSSSRAFAGSSRVNRKPTFHSSDQSEPPLGRPDCTHCDRNCGVQGTLRNGQKEDAGLLSYRSIAPKERQLLCQVLRQGKLVLRPGQVCGALT